MNGLCQSLLAPQKMMLDPTLEQTQKPYLTIRPSAGWQAINLRQIWQYRDLLMTLGSRDVKLRYRQTALGALWVILQPLLGAGILSFVFNKVASVPTGSIPPFLFSYAGMLGFTLFSSTLTKTSGVLVGNSQLISKVYFPRLVLPLSTVFSSLIDFGVALCMMVVLMLSYHVAPGVGVLLLPVWLVLIILLAIGCGLYTSAVMVTYRDVQYALPVLVNFLTFASPVAYPVAFVITKVPGAAKTWYFLLNPLASLLEAFRWSLLGSGTVPWGYVAYSSMLSVIVFIAGAVAFKRMERKFADVI